MCTKRQSQPIFGTPAAMVGLLPGREASSITQSRKPFDLREKSSNGVSRRRKILTNSGLRRTWSIADPTKVE